MKAVTDPATVQRVAAGPMAVSTSGLGKQFTRPLARNGKWALRDCTLEVPEGRICGLVGANGAGKTTLLRLLAGLARPTAGSVHVRGRAPRDSSEFLRDIGYLAQDVPLYGRWTVADHLAFGAQLNPEWDDAATRDRLRTVGVPFDQRVGTLSGGQRAQVGLALALGKRPRVLLLDEPVAALDPLARREFLGTLAGAVAAAEGELTVVLSTHLVNDLERLCDHVIVLSESRTVLAGSLDEVLDTHRLLSRGPGATTHVERDHVVLRSEHTRRQTRLWVRLEGPLTDPTWEIDELSLEEIVLAYLGRGRPDERSPIVEAGESL